MTDPRPITSSVRGMKTNDGAGVKLTRFIGTPLLRSLDPFLMLDAFGSDEPTDYLAGFPDHPHRGFETITYMIEGKFRHKDNKGHEGLLQTGGAQWMTAGRGIVHSEMPEQVSGRVAGFQLWLNLPAKDKLCEPGYKDVQAEEMPVVRQGGAQIRVLAGTVDGVTGPIADARATAPMYLDVSIPEGERVRLAIPATHAGFVHPFEGGVVVEGAREHRLDRVELGVLGAGDELRLRADAGPARLLVVAGKPLREPVVQYGPFVMNTPEQIEQAIRDFQAGRF